MFLQIKIKKSAEGCECENYTWGNLTANIEVDEVALEKLVLHIINGQ